MAFNYSNSAFVTLTNISSSVMNAYFTDIRTFLNNTNVQARAFLANGTAYALVANSSTGAMSQITPGSTGQVLTQTSTAAQWETITDSKLIRNLGLSSGTPSSNAITVSLKQADGSSDPSSTGPVKAAFRSSTIGSSAINLRSVTSSLSLTLQSGVTLGLPTGSGRVYWYLIDSDGAGTIKLGASSSKLDDTQLHSSTTTQRTGTCTAAAPGVWTVSTHGLENGDVVRLTNSGGALPSGFSANTDYYVVNKTTSTFELATSAGGTGVTASDTGTGTHYVNVANTKLVSDGVYASAPIRLIGAIDYTIVTSGQWVAASSYYIGTFLKKNPTIQKLTSGSGTYIRPYGVTWLRVKAVGGGGGGNGSGATTPAGGTGGNTTFGSSLLTANGGAGASSGGAGGAGGTATIGTGATGIALQGGKGGGAVGNSLAFSPSGGVGAASPLGGAGGSAAGNTTGGSAITNTGSGGGGAGAASGNNAGGGGGAGGYIEAIIESPSSSYSYAVGAAGTAGSAGSGGSAGGAGGSGVIIVTEYYD